MTTEPAAIIDADEFEAARNDPRVQAFWVLVEEYAADLVQRGHCPRCLVVNCQCR